MPAPPIKRYNLTPGQALDMASAMVVECPRCKSAIGESCVLLTVNGQRTDDTRDWPHNERYAAAGYP